jgi:hypothetical protein
VSVLLAFAASDWIVGTTLLASTWRVRRSVLRRPRVADRLAPPAPTPLADEIEDWLMRR